MIKRSISSVICVMMMFSLLVGVLPQPSYAASGPWDLLNDNLSSFTSTGWTEQKTTGFTGSVTQNTGNVTIMDASDKSTYLLKQPVAPASGAFTFEAIAKVNATGTLNEFTVRGASYLISFYLTYGTSGVVQNKASSSTKSYVAVPKINAAGFDMFMFDDGWNNANDTGTSRDGVEALPSITNDMKGLADYFQNKGLLLGMWYSMTGGYHNRGNDLADPAVIAAKKEKISYLIDNYHLSHQMVDLTEFWPNSDVTTYSHPTDNVYRKNVLTNHVLNEVVDENPDYMVKYTTEVDIWPTQE
ncbi:hypothetical protein PAECIP111891_02414 [Paenibacillus allorhizoplanae]|uniref:Alpha-galactosidase n=1 Tax=Paenibacillus allorhizoplanae TaxID=2905648 RepID=A0ABM9C775_9BACL|nr:hypothetical protein [Paenibacillus allorhizoplanae]CAH1203752.1 hypothetical protein PAECIP111891_02414 [Paenibacillus allorhizoplanae]